MAAAIAWAFTADHSGRAVAAAGCPRSPLALPANAVPRAADAALREAARLYPQSKGRSVVVTSELARVARGPEAAGIREQCGRRVQNRSVIVMLEFPAVEDSASLGQGTVFVARSAEGYRVWKVFH